MKLSHFVGTIVLLVTGGVVHGMWTHRWTDRPTQTGVDLLAPLEQPVGGWNPGPTVPVSEQEIPRGTVVVSRRFTGGSPRREAVVSVTSGVPGVVAAHTPDVCFLGSGYHLRRPPVKESLPLPGGGIASFYVADFEKTTATGTENVRCRWAWTADGTWHAPDYPRLFFAKSQARLPVLYKLYIVEPIPDEDLTGRDHDRTFAAALAGVLGQQFHPE